MGDATGYPASSSFSVSTAAANNRVCCVDTCETFYSGIFFFDACETVNSGGIFFFDAGEIVNNGIIFVHACGSISRISFLRVTYR